MIKSYLKLPAHKGTERKFKFSLRLEKSHDPKNRQFLKNIKTTKIGGVVGALPLPL